jgi:hypothetical protein
MGQSSKIDAFQLQQSLTGDGRGGAAADLIGAGQNRRMNIRAGTLASVEA